MLRRTRNGGNRMRARESKDGEANGEDGGKMEMKFEMKRAKEGRQ